MATNPLFQTTHQNAGEWNLYQDLVDEYIKIAGFDVFYMPRKLLANDKVYGESAQCSYDSAIPIEMSLVNTTGWSGGQDLMSHFGFENQDDATLTVSRRRFIQEVVEKNSAEDPIQYPREGDLIYYPVFSALFEIVFVEIDVPFRQLGNRFVYEIKIKRYINSHAFFNTGIPEVDRINNLNVDGDNTRTDIRKEPNQDNTALKQEAGNRDLEAMFDTDTKVTTDPLDPTKIIKINRGAGPSIINFREKEAQIGLENNFASY